MAIPVGERVHTGIWVYSGKGITIKRCVLSNLTQGIIFRGTQDYHILNCTIVGPADGEAREGVSETNCAGENMIKNSIIWGFGPSVEVNSPRGTTTISYNNVYGSYFGIPDQTGLNGNIQENREFFYIYALNFSLTPSSPCINTGDPATPLDPDGTRVEIGALPFLPKTIYVSTTGSDVTGDGSMGNPYGTIQYGIDDGSVYDTVQVMAGAHHVSDDIILKPGVYVRGDGADATEVIRDYPYDQDSDFSVFNSPLNYSLREVTIEKLKITTPISTEGKVHNGIKLSYEYNVTIKSCVLFNFYNGIYDIGSDQFTYENNTIFGQVSGIAGSAIYSSGINGSIKNNILTNFDYGINLTGSGKYGLLQRCFYELCQPIQWHNRSDRD